VKKRTTKGTQPSNRLVPRVWFGVRVKSGNNPGETTKLQEKKTWMSPACPESTKNPEKKFAANGEGGMGGESKLKKRRMLSAPKRKRQEQWETKENFAIQQRRTQLIKKRGDEKKNPVR